MEKNELVNIATQLVTLEDDLKKFNEIKKQYDNMKAQLTDAMIEAGLLKLIAPNGTIFTLVAAKPDENIPVVKFNEAQFKAEHPDIWEEYQWMTHEYKPGRKAYVKITIPKGE